MLANSDAKYELAGDNDGYRDTEKIPFHRVLISGAGFLADAYDLFVINIAADLMSRCNYEQPLSSATKSLVKSMAVAGAIVGQIAFGAFADLIGRRIVFIATCSLVIAGALLSGLVVNSAGSFGIYSQLALWRFVLGVGVGGEYPLSAAITTESSASGSEIRNLAMVFSMQGAGTLLCALVLVTLTSTMGDNYDSQWRLALLLGAAPMVVAFYFRWKMHETAWRSEEQRLVQVKRVTFLHDRVLLASPPHKGSSAELTEGTVQTAESGTGEASPHPHHPHHLRGEGCWGAVAMTTVYLQEGYKVMTETVRVNYWNLLGTAGSWFILDVVFYGNGLFSGEVTEAMQFAHGPKSEATAALVLQVMSVPGYICSIFYASAVGLRRLQLCGFAATAVFFLALSALQPYLVRVPAVYVVAYGLTFFAQNFGPNTTTYIVPSLLFSASHRGTCHGISAAAGKLGALVGAQTFMTLVDSYCEHGTCSSSSPAGDVSAGLRLTFFACGIVCIVGFFWTYFLVPDLMVRRNTDVITTDVCIEESAWPSQAASGATGRSAQLGTALQMMERAVAASAASAASPTSRGYLLTRPSAAKISTCTGTGTGNGTATGGIPALGEAQTPFVEPFTMTPNALLWEDEVVSEVVFNPLFYGDDVI